MFDQQKVSMTTVNAGPIGTNGQLAQPIEAETKWPLFCRRHFEMHFLQ